MNTGAETLSPEPAVVVDDVALTALAELQFLCEQRYGAVRSADITAAALDSFDERLSAFLDAILSRGPHVVDWLVATLANAESPYEVCGIAIALLESRSAAAAQSLLSAIEASQEEPKRMGFQMALRRGPCDMVLPTLQEWLQTGTSQQAVAAAEVLAYHQPMSKSSPRLSQLMHEADPIVRRAAWRAMAFLDRK